MPLIRLPELLSARAFVEVGGQSLWRYVTLLRMA